MGFSGINEGHHDISGTISRWETLALMCEATRMHKGPANLLGAIVIFRALIYLKSDQDPHPNKNL